jgi:hypothetical protein
VNIFILKKALKDSWCKETAYHKDSPNWSLSNPSVGQCAITALVVNHYFGGKIISGVSDDGIYHFWNKIYGIKIDFTKDQFRMKKKFKNIKVWNRGELLETGDVQNRYYMLLERVFNYLLKRGVNYLS